MALERVERQGWFARLRSAVAGIVIGIVLVGGAGVLQFWNEGRTLRQQQMLDAGRAEVVSIQASAAVRSVGGRVFSSFLAVATSLCRAATLMRATTARADSPAGAVSRRSIRTRRTALSCSRLTMSWAEDTVTGDGSSFGTIARSSRPNAFALGTPDSANVSSGFRASGSETSVLNAVNRSP